MHLKRESQFLWLSHSIRFKQRANVALYDTINFEPNHLLTYVSNGIQTPSIKDKQRQTTHTWNATFWLSFFFIAPVDKECALELLLWYRHISYFATGSLRIHLLRYEKMQMKLMHEQKRHIFENRAVVISPGRRSLKARAFHLL